MFLVLIEWDGLKPSNTYYNRIRKELGLNVRGNKTKKDRNPNPLERRREVSRFQDSANESIVFQEGAVLCSSEYLARTVLMYAKSFGAKSVQMYSALGMEFHMTDADTKIMDNLESKAGQRGRKSSDTPKSDFAVTCYEEQLTTQVKEQYYVVSCPSCSSTLVNAVTGEVPILRVPDDCGVFEAWSRHRFARGFYEVPTVGGLTHDFPPIQVSITKSDEEMVWNKMRDSKKLQSEIKEVLASTDRLQAFRMLDAVFAGRRYKPRTSRQDGRVQACVKLYAKGVTPQEASIVETEEYDILDGAFVNPTKVAALWMRSIHKES